MALWLAAIWGLAGGMSVEGVELYARIHHVRDWSWRKPIPQGLAAYLLSLVIRAGFSAGLTTAAAASDQVVGAFAMFGIGVAAPLVIEKLARGIPLSLDSSMIDLTPLSGEPMSGQRTEPEVTEARDAR
jgi:hypothetical protein